MEKLRNKFKNLRRQPKKCVKPADVSDDVFPPSKKFRVNCVSKSALIEPSSSEKAIYEQHVKHLQGSYSTSKYPSTTMITLLEETAALRKKWIVEDCPTVKDVLEKFSCLKEPKMVCFYKFVLATYVQ